VPEALRKLTYDEYRQIEFRPERELWRGQDLPFHIQFFHPGNLYDRVLPMWEVRDGKAQSIPFRREDFTYGSLQLGPLPESLGFAGLKIVRGLNWADGEVGVFLGASYFRFLGQGTTYGLSARGLALDTAVGGGAQEEFPHFTAFWLERPAANAKSLTFHALLDSPSVAGAYRFIVTPGATTVTQVKAVLFNRKNAQVFGVAPLTSMYWRGENSAMRSDDFRPEVHDSDGLLMHNGQGEWIWRPLSNPPAVRVTTFSDDNPRAFGLLQRDRNFDSYQDLEASYHTRPSAWVEPVGRWGKGTVRLVEIPTANEFADNVVAFWMPETLPPPGEPIELEYRLHWFLDQIRPASGYTVATRFGRSGGHQPDLDRFLVDFDGPELRREAADAAIVPVLEVGQGGQLSQSVLQKNPNNGTWRLTFSVKPDASRRPIELRCYLRKGSRALTETWSYLWQP
jgi:glucans biosynthesis protein